MIKLLSFVWLFNASQQSHSALSATARRAEFAAPPGTSNGFTVKLSVDLQPFDQDRTILSVRDVLTVRLRRLDPADRARQNYPAFRMPDGSAPVLEATLVLHSAQHPDWPEMTVGLPIAMLAEPWGPHQIVLNFTGVRWTLYVDGELVDNDFPCGYPVWPDTTS